MKRTKLHLPGLPPIESIEVVSDAKANEADYMICVPADYPTPFTDNLTGFCCRCGFKIQYRWHAPRKPKKICMKCMAGSLYLAM
jgi:hypothetical protein